jgi:hypothetical protein
MNKGGRCLAPSSRYGRHMLQVDTLIRAMPGMRLSIPISHFTGAGRAISDDEGRYGYHHASRRVLLG